jgi:hypothetical protein
MQWNWLSHQQQSINIPNGFPNDVTVYNTQSAKWTSTSPKINRSAECISSETTPERSRTFPNCNQVALGHSHPRPSGWRKLGVDSNPRWVNEARFRLQPPLPADAAGRSEHTGFQLRTRHGVSVPNTGGLPRIGFGGYFTGPWAASSGQSSRDPTPLHSSSITSLTLPAAIPSSSAASCTRQRNQCLLRQRARQHHLPGRGIVRALLNTNGTQPHSRTFLPACPSSPRWKWEIRRCISTTGRTGIFPG